MFKHTSTNDDNNFARKKYFVYIVFFLLIFSFFYFYFFNKENSVWAYLDSSYQIGFLFKNNFRIRDLFSIFFDFTYFDFDTSQINFSRYLTYLIEYLLKGFFELRFANSLYFSLYFFISFYSCSEVLFFFNGRKKFKFEDFIAPLFFSINPMSLFFINEPGFIFAYPSLFLLVLGFIKYFRKDSDLLEKLFGLIITFFGLNFMFSYPRVLLAYLLLAIPVFIFILRRKQLFTIKWGYLLKYALLQIIVILPFFVSFGWDLFNNSKSIANYVVGYDSNSFSYDSSLDRGIIDNSIIRTIGNFNNVPGLYTFPSLLIYITLVWYLLKNDYKKNYSVFLIFLINTSLANLALFLNLAQFNFITYKVLPFLSNTTLWTLPSLVNILTVILFISFNSEYKKHRFPLIFAVLILISVTIYPLLHWNIRTDLVTESVLRETVGSKLNVDGISTVHRRLLLPNYNLLLHNYPYPINFSYLGSFNELFKTNTRFTGFDSAKSDVYGNNLFPGDETAYCKYGIEEVVIFKNLSKPKEEFEFYSGNKYIDLSRKNIELLRNSRYFKESFSNDYLVVYRSDLFDNTSIIDVYNQNHLSKDNFYCDALEYKLAGVEVTSENNDFYYLLKIPDSDGRFLRLYKQYYPHWKLIAVDEDFYNIARGKFDETSFINKISIIKKLTAFYSDKNPHFEGAISENIWDLSNSDDTRFLLFNQKNVYYFLSQIVSLTYLFLLIIFYILISFYKFIKRIRAK